MPHDGTDIPPHKHGGRKSAIERANIASRRLGYLDCLVELMEWNIKRETSDRVLHAELKRLSDNLRDEHKREQAA